MALKQDARQQLREEVCTLSSVQRELVERTITDHCLIRGWRLHAVNCRTQHVHVVVSAPGCDPKMVMDQFKAWCTRRLKEHQRAILERQSAGQQSSAGLLIRQKWWTQRGSKRYLYDNKSLEAAVVYVSDGQG